jgi:hypothetical protein
MIAANAKHEITLKEVAKCEGMNAVYLRRLATHKGFPDPLRMIGPTKMYDWRAVNRYFRDREKLKRKVK